jgi:peptidyl-prolyl cis-trans isomerase SurA
MFLFFFAITFAQDEDVLFTVNDKPVYASEFERVYNKNLDLIQDDTQNDIDSYLNLFVNYKLKLEEAYHQDLHKEANYVRELKGYERQLTQKYTNNSEVTDKLVSEAYQRLGKEINANHVLVKLSPNASKAEEEKAISDILALRSRVVKEGFNKVQKEVHNGQTVFAENLGYFTAFKMVYNFENAAYNTKIGDVSEPFKTEFGYHVVIVNDIRKNRGEVTVAHIMVGVNDKDLIETVYKRLEQGEDFKALAKQYSIDKSSNSKGGLLKPFSGGQLSSQLFEEEAFRLEKKGDFSMPFKTKFGWHITKLYAKKGLDVFEAEKRGLQNKVKRDSRSRVLDEKRILSLLKTYNVNYENVHLIDFEKGMNDRFFKGLWNAPENLKTDKELLKIKHKVITYKDFTNFLSKSQRKPQSKKEIKELVLEQYKSFVNSNVYKFQEENLINENEEYAHVLKEYKEGLLLFELMGEQIWNSSKNDSVALESYFNANKPKYFFNKRIKASIASSKYKKDAKNVLKERQKNQSEQAIIESYNSNEVLVTFNTGTFNLNDNAIPSNLKLEKGLSKIYKHNDTFISLNILEILPKQHKSFTEAKGIVMSDFQDDKEQKWLKELKVKYPVKINRAVYNTIKGKY